MKDKIEKSHIFKKFNDNRNNNNNNNYYFVFEMIRN